MKIQITQANVLATAVGLFAAWGQWGQAAADAVADPAVLDDKMKIKITCSGDGTEWKCKVKGKKKYLVDTDPINGDDGQADAPEGWTNERPFIVIGDAPSPIHTLDGPGPHCWVKVAGRYYSIHC